MKPEFISFDSKFDDGGDGKGGGKGGALISSFI
jgi:hypothetical protein